MNTHVDHDLGGPIEAEKDSASFAKIAFYLALEFRVLDIPKDLWEPIKEALDCALAVQKKELTR